MKKKITFLFVMALMLPVMLHAATPDNDPQRPDYWQATITIRGGTTSLYRLSHDGDIVPGRNEFSDIGESSHTYKEVFTAQLSASSGIQVVRDVWTNAASTGAADLFSVSPAAGAAVSTGVVVVTADMTQMKYARTIVFQSTFVFNASTHNLTVGVTVFGVDAFGKTRSSSYLIPFATTAFHPNDIAWSNISSMSFIATGFSLTPSEGKITFQVGFSSGLGLSNVLISSGDVVKIIEAEADNVNDSNVNFSNNIFYPETVVDGSTEHEVHYIHKESRR